LSPYQPPAHNDTTFVTDVGADLDTGCTYQSAGPLDIEIPIDRYPGNIDNLLNQGFAVYDSVFLSLPAWDVDYTGGPTDRGNVGRPERDTVYFNGHLVSRSGFLQGSDNTWELNHFSVPLKWVNFPSDPGEGGTIRSATNRITIDIDIHNPPDNYCTDIDWASLRIAVPRPMLLVPGAIGGGDPWAFWLGKFEAMGVPAVTVELGSFNGMEQNAGKIGIKVEELRRRWGVDKLNILATSKGGNDARAYVEDYDTAKRLVQLGTPNAGSPLADRIQIFLLYTIGLPGTIVVDALVGPASYELTTIYMLLFYNPWHGHNNQTSYVSLAGNYKFGPPFGLIDNWFTAFYFGRNDLIVPVWSVHALPYADRFTYSSVGFGSGAQAQHFELKRSPDVFNMLVPTFLPFAKPGMHPSGASPLAATDLPAAPATDSAPASTSPVSGLIHQGETLNQTLDVDGPGPVAFSLLYGTGHLDLTLVSPSGRRIDPGVAETDPNIGFTNLADIEGMHSDLYTIDNPEAGRWVLQVTAISVVNPSGQEVYGVMGLISNSPISLEATTDRLYYRSGDPIVLRGQLQGGITGSAAEVAAKVVHPDDTFEMVPLLDDGSGGDAVSGDGIYTSSFTDTIQAGVYRMLIVAEGQAQPFSRSQVLLATVSASTSHFSGAVTGSGVDTDGDGLFNSLTTYVGLDITRAGNYRVLGVLADATGTEIANTTVAATLGVGVQFVPLSFAGERIHDQGRNGPYILKDVRLVEDAIPSVLPLDQQSNLYSSPGYLHTQFQHPPIYVAGTGADAGIDTNGNGLFDTLEVTVHVTVDVAGPYKWTGILADHTDNVLGLSGGHELGTFSGSGTLSAGLNQITLSFPGSAIGQSGASGPYALSYLSITGPADYAMLLDTYKTATYVAGQFEGGPPNPFTDVNPTDYFYAPVLYLASHHIIGGYADGTFRPYADTTRAQMVKIVVLGFGTPIATLPEGSYTFHDVLPGSPFFNVIEAAADEGIISGYPCGGPVEPCDTENRSYFRPNANVTRGQLSKISVAAAGWPLQDPADATFNDVAAGSPFYTFVETAGCHGVVSGYANGTFRPGANATRGQIAKVVYLSITGGSKCNDQ
jgi:hypothetical protein